MTNKPMLSVERELLAKLIEEGRISEISDAEWKELRALLDADKVNSREMGLMQYVEAHPIKPAAQHRGDPVCAQIRYRRPEKGCHDWGDWHDLKLCRFDENRTHYIDSVGWECETRALFAEQPAPVAVVMPERMDAAPFTTIDRGSKNYKAGYNAALTEVARLNGVKP